MSYEHCATHDCDATNGCPRCSARDDEAEARAAVTPLVAEFEAHLYPPDPRDLMDLALAAYRLGKLS